jgi:hypothetical protein
MKKYLLMILMLSTLFFVNCEYSYDPKNTKTIYNVRVSEYSQDVLSFNNLEEVNSFMDKNAVYPVYIKFSSSRKWYKYFGKKRCTFGDKTYSSCLWSDGI